MADNGSGNYGGNGSIWWRQVHGRQGGPPRNIVRWNGNPGQQPAGGDWVKVGDQQETEVIGHDPVPVGQVGSANKRGLFKITLRYTTNPVFAVAGGGAAGGGAASASTGGANQAGDRAEMRARAIQELQALVASANAALNTIQQAPAASDVDVAVEAFVPARRRTNMPGPNEWEVNVDW